MKLSTSKANTFKACPRRYYYQEVEGFTQAIPPPWLAKGSAYDKLLEYWDDGYAKALEMVPELFPNPYEAQDAYLIIKAYDLICWDAVYPPVKVNEKSGNQHGYGVPVTGVNFMSSPEGLKLTGYLDKLSSKDGKYVVIERKTTSESIEPNSEYWNQWELNPQTIGYVWYLRSLGLPAGKVVVEVIRKLSTTVNKVYDKKTDLVNYVEQTNAHVEKKTVVARREFYVSTDKTDEWVVDQVCVAQNIKFHEGRQEHVIKHGYEGMYAWPKHEKSCKDFGGCPFLGVCQGKTELTNKALFAKSAKYLKELANKIK